MGVIEKAKIDRLTRERDEAIAERDELQRLFDLQWTRSREADAMWKSAHPESNVAMVDLGELLKWMMELIRAATPVMIRKGIVAAEWQHLLAWKDE